VVGRAYSQDLRDRVMAAIDSGTGAYAAASIFRVSVSYIYKVLARRKRTGATSARPWAGAEARWICRNPSCPCDEPAAELDRADIAEARREWCAGQPDLNPEPLVFIDETWAKTNTVRLYGRLPRGQRLIAPVPHGHWMTTTFVAALRRFR
jgi:hypothetical protein